MNNSSVLRVLPTLLTFFLYLMLITNISLAQSEYNDTSHTDNEDEQFYIDEETSTDNTGEWIFVRDKPYSMMLYNVFNRKDKKIEFGLDIAPDVAVYSPVNNKMFLTGSNFEQGGLLLIINTITGEEELRKRNFYYNGPMFLSRDESKAYVSYEDTIETMFRESKMKIAVFSTTKNKLLKTKNLKSLGHPGVWGYNLVKGNKGKGIIESVVMKNNKFIGAYYNIYDFDNNVSSPFIFYRRGVEPYFTNNEKYLSHQDVEPYFTSNGKYLILRGIIDSLSEDTIVAYPHNSGYYFIYDIAKQKLIKTLKFPPQWNLYLYSDFPDSIFHFNDKTRWTLNLSLDSIIKTPSGPTDSPKVIMYNLGTTEF
ncbi:MAG: hypothetical protein P4L35_09670, partial [Ignavibacteriaceae bacterium]|nr:hypothetical protein [Ignavibacteriaceae bacterium]